MTPDLAADVRRLVEHHDAAPCLRAAPRPRCRRAGADDPRSTASARNAAAACADPPSLAPSRCRRRDVHPLGDSHEARAPVRTPSIVTRHS
jgi:hypothetical protein